MLGDQVETEFPHLLGQLMTEKAFLKICKQIVLRPRLRFKRKGPCPSQSLAVKQRDGSEFHRINVIALVL